MLLSIPPIPKPPVVPCEELYTLLVGTLLWFYFVATMLGCAGGKRCCVKTGRLQQEVFLQRLCPPWEGAESRLTLNCCYSMPCFDFLLLYQQILIRHPWQMMAVTIIAQVPHGKRLTLFINSQQRVLAATGSCSLPPSSGLSPCTGQLQSEGAQSV